MAYELIWAPSAKADLRDIIAFIARDSRARAEAFGYRLVAHAERLQAFPESGHIVREFRRPEIRQLLVRSYRIIYRIDYNRELVQVIRVWHAARGTPDLK